MSADPTQVPRRIPVIGLTGGIASGKSTVSRWLAEWGAHIIDADQVGHAVIAPDGEAYPEVILAFGTEILNEDGTISRPLLGKRIFSDPGARLRLNEISHPRMGERMAREIRRIRALESPHPPPLILLDAAILFEAKWDRLCDRVWSVQSDPEIAVERLIARNSLSREDAQARLDSQLRNLERARLAHAVITNDGTLEELRDKVKALWQEQTGLSVC